MYLSGIISWRLWNGLEICIAQIYTRKGVFVKGIVNLSRVNQKLESLKPFTKYHPCLCHQSPSPKGMGKLLDQTETQADLSVKHCIILTQGVEVGDSQVIIQVHSHILSAHLCFCVSLAVRRVTCLYLIDRVKVWVTLMSTFHSSHSFLHLIPVPVLVVKSTKPPLRSPLTPTGDRVVW